MGGNGDGDPELCDKASPRCWQRRFGWIWSAPITSTPRSDLACRISSTVPGRQITPPAPTSVDTEHTSSVYHAMAQITGGLLHLSGIGLRIEVFNMRASN